MVIRKLLIKIFKYINSLLDEWIDRLMFMEELKEWEAEKRSEGFPKEWFKGEE